MNQIRTQLLLLTLVPACLMAQESMHDDAKAGTRIHTEILTPPTKDGLPKPPDGYQWARIDHLSDEFEGSQLDETKWMPRHPYWSGRNSLFTPSNVSVSDGNLHLRSTLRDGSKKVKASTVTSACVSSRDRNCQPGFYEARIKASNLSMTSAFWFQGKGIEIDVIENIGNPSSRRDEWIETTMMMNTHFKQGRKKSISTPRKWQMPSRARDDYHVFGVWWKDPETVWLYHNGAKVMEITPGGPFDRPQYMFFDTEVFTWHGWPRQENLLDPEKNTMRVDWVRAWELVPTDS